MQIKESIAIENHHYFFFAFYNTAKKSILHIIEDK